MTSTNGVPLCDGGKCARFLAAVAESSSAKRLTAAQHDFARRIGTDFIAMTKESLTAAGLTEDQRNRVEAELVQRLHAKLVETGSDQA